MRQRGGMGRERTGARRFRRRGKRPSGLQEGGNKANEKENEKGGGAVLINKQAPTDSHHVQLGTTNHYHGAERFGNRIPPPTTTFRIPPRSR